MRKELITHFSFVAAFFLLISLVRGWFDPTYIPFWIGGIIGTLLPDIDHLIYVYFLRPQEPVSQKASEMVGNKDYSGALNLLTNSRGNRTKLIFHTGYFQILFMIFTFFVITSSGSLLGWGLVLSFSLHLLVDQYIDLTETGRLATWFKEFPANMESQQMRWYLIVVLVLLLIFGFLL
ncbi:MAG: metal-dependent hydrolase [Patescibacteria group bacterium]